LVVYNKNKKDHFFRKVRNQSGPRDQRINNIRAVESSSVATSGSTCFLYDVEYSVPVQT
jgi:hypothetical protein